MSMDAEAAGRRLNTRIRVPTFTPHGKGVPRLGGGRPSEDAVNGLRGRYASEGGTIAERAVEIVPRRLRWRLDGDPAIRANKKGPLVEAPPIVVTRC